MPFEIPKSWVWCHLDDCCQIVGRIGFRGYTKEDLVSEGQGAITLSPSNIVNGRMDYSKCTYISWGKYEESPEIKVNNGDILLVKTGSSYGKCAFVESLFEKATINPQFVVLRHISINPEFLTLILQSQYARKCYNEFVIGTAIPTFTQEKLSNMFIPLPPIYEQNRIISQVSKLMVLISHIAEESLFLFKNIEHVKSKILELAITGKLVPQNPDDEPAAELLRRINPEAQIVTDNGHYPQLPQGWCYTLLQNLAKTDTGFPFDSSRFSLEPKGRKPLIRIRDIKKGYTGTFTDEDCANSYIVKYGDMLIGMDGDFNLAKWASEDALLNQRVCRIRSLNENLLLSEYLYFSLPSFLAEINGSTSSITVKHLSTRQIDNIIFPIPPINEQKRIVERIHSFLAAIDLICNSI